MKKKCLAKECKVNGGWSAWSSWSRCSCDTSTRSRDRKCTKPKPQYGGKECKGLKTMTNKCLAKECKVDGGWSAWSDFSACSVSCGVGVKYSTRICNNPKTQHGGKDCVGDSQYRTQCDMKLCKGKYMYGYSVTSYDVIYFSTLNRVIIIGVNQVFTVCVGFVFGSNYVQFHIICL